MIIRFLLWCLVVLILTRLLNRLRQTGRRRRPGGPVPDRGELLVRDPVCGIFVPAAGTLSLAAAGQTVHFCSKTCADRWARARTPADSTVA